MATAGLTGWITPFKESNLCWKGGDVPNVLSPAVGAILIHPAVIDQRSSTIRTTHIFLEFPRKLQLDRAGD